MTRQFQAILQLLKAQKADQRFGRASLCKKLAEGEIHLSEEQVKTRLKSLKKQELVTALAGKGTIITAAGLRYLEQLTVRQAAE